MLKRFAFVALSFTCVSAVAQSVGLPDVKAGDSWIYTHTVESKQQGWQRQDIESSVQRVGEGAIELSNKLRDSTNPPVTILLNPDWSRAADMGGQQTLVTRPFNFPMSVGKTWEIRYTQPNPQRKYSSQSIDLKYTVTGWEDVQVPAGTFHALKVECQGNWSAVFAPNVTVEGGISHAPDSTISVSESQRVTPHTTSGRMYRAYWYVPSQKRFVKLVEETYGSAGVRSQSVTEELVSSKVSN